MPRKPAADEDVREAVLRAADELFYERGIHEVSMDELRDRSGVALKRLYGLFPAKSDLVAAYLRARAGHLQEAVEAYVTGRTADPKEQLVATFDALGAYIAGQAAFQGCAFHRAYGELSGTSPETVAIVREQKDALRRFLLRTAKRAQVLAPGTLASQLLLLFEGTLITAAISGDPGAARHAKAAA